MSDLNPSPASLTPATGGAGADGDRCGGRHHHHHHRRGGFIRGLLAGALLFGVVAGAAYVGSSHAQGGFGHGRHTMSGGPFGNAAFDPETASKRIDAMTNFVLADVDATAEQKTKISGIAKETLKDLLPLRDQHKAARTKAVELLAAPAIDRAAMEQLRASELALAETASKRVTQALADVAETLQPSQRAKLAEKMKQRMARHG